MSVTPLEFIEDVALHNQVFFKNARQDILIFSPPPRYLQPSTKY